MTDHIDSEPSAAELAALSALLGDAGLWDAPSPDLEQAVVRAIEAEAGTVAAEVEPPVRLADRRRLRPAWLGAAAAAIVVVVLAATLLTRPDSDGTVFALAGTEAAPQATGEATVSATPAGLKILLVARGLPGAPDGYMYEAWVSDGTLGVSAGTFHLRGGDGPIELWAGVTDDRFHRLTITLEPVDGDATSSRDARLVGTIAIGGG
ncbi:MAG: anti-sigma factor [Ilumatobacter sp.]|nr:anti-sigma factor [Ilumatobacter sp.]